MPAGNGIGDIIALFFPWQGRIYTMGYYDTPIVIPGVGIISNYYRYFGILAVPSLIYLLYTSELRKKYVFFWMWFFTVAFLYSKFANKLFPLMLYFEKIMNTNSNENWIIIDVIICFNMIVVLTLDDIVKKRRSDAIDVVNDYKIMNKLLTVLMVIYTFVVLAWVTVKVVLIYAGSVINKLFTVSPFSSLIMNDNYFIGLQLVLYSYFYDHFFYLLLISFLVRLITLWLFKNRLLLQKMPYDVVIIVILVAIDLILFNYYIYPFTSSNDISYSKEIKQNAFIEKVVNPTERVGAFPIELKIPYKLQNILKSMREKYGGTIPWDPVKIHTDYSAFNVDKGYFEPLFDPGSTFYPVTVGKQIYNNHQSLLPLYFWEYDKAMNKDSGIYYRQSWVSIQNPHSRLLDAAGIKYIFWYQPVADSRLELVERYPIGDGYIYLNKRAVPKAYIVSNIEYYTTNDKVLERLAEETFDPHTTITTDDIELIGKFLPDNSTIGGSADIEEYSADRIIVTTKARQNSMLVITDLYFPYWTATINGTESKIYRVNGVFRGIILDKGENRVVLEFYNKYYHMGLKISLFTLILTLLLLAVSGLRRSTL
ncbi:MAG: YfhO family protein [Nitrospirota bacterium]